MRYPWRYVLLFALLSGFLSLFGIKEALEIGDAVGGLQAEAPAVPDPARFYMLTGRESKLLHEIAGGFGGPEAEAKLQEFARVAASVRTYCEAYEKRAVTEAAVRRFGALLEARREYDALSSGVVDMVRTKAYRKALAFIEEHESVERIYNARLYDLIQAEQEHESMLHDKVLRHLSLYGTALGLWLMLLALAVAGIAFRCRLAKVWK